MCLEFIIKGQISGPSQIENIWNIKVFIGDFVCDKINIFNDIRFKRLDETGKDCIVQRE